MGRNEMRYDIDRKLATRGAHSKCPCCKSDIIAKVGEIKAPHWAHKSSEDCDTFSEGMTDWHIGWQDKFPSDWQEIVIGNHRADVQLPNGLVIEFQHSQISVEKIREREEFYKANALGMIWVFDYIWKDEYLTAWRPDESNNDNHKDEAHMYVGSSGRTINRCEAPVLLDVSNVKIRMRSLSKWKSGKEICPGTDKIIWKDFDSNRTTHLLISKDALMHYLIEEPEYFMALTFLKDVRYNTALAKRKLEQDKLKEEIAELESKRKAAAAELAKQETERQATLARERHLKEQETKAIIPEAVVIAAANKPKEKSEEIDYLNDDQKKLIEVLEYNAKDTITNKQSYYKAVDNIDAALKSLDLDYEQQVKQAKILRRIYDEPYWIYRPAELGNTPRLTANNGPTLLCREFRNLWYKGCYEYDIRCSQLAILAGILKLPNLIKLIKGGDPWAYFTKKGEYRKEVVKPFIYSLIYGMSEDKLKDEAQKHRLDYLLTDAIFVELLKKRDEWWSSFPKDQSNTTYIEDCYGKRYYIQSAGCHPGFADKMCWNNKDRHPGSLAASYTQAIEFAIMSKVAYLENIKYHIVGWIHDSVITKTNVLGRTKALKEISMFGAIKEAVENAAKFLGDKYGFDFSAITIEEKQL